MSKKNGKNAAAQPTGGRVYLVGRPEWWGKYILGLIETGTSASAAHAAGTSKANARQVIERNPELKEEVEEAQELRRGIIRKALLDIGTKGIILPTYALDQRTIIGYETKWSPQVLLALATELPEYNRALNASNNKSPDQDERPALTPEDADAIVAAIARRVAARQAPAAIPDGC